MQAVNGDLCVICGAMLVVICTLTILHFSHAHVLFMSAACHALDPRPQVHDGEEYNSVAAGEEVAIDVTFQNPLAIKLPLTRVRLLLEFRAPHDAAAGAAAPIAAGKDGSGKAGDTSSSSGISAHHVTVAGIQQQQQQQQLTPELLDPPPPSIVVVQEASFTLHPGASLVIGLVILIMPLPLRLLLLLDVVPLLTNAITPVQLHNVCALVNAGEVLTQRLSLRPQSQGWLRVHGVAWLLADSAQGAMLFNIKGRRRKRPKGDR